MKNNGRYPLQIVFFRDGVSEGEYARIANSEIAEIRSRLSALSRWLLTESLVECLENLVAFERNGQRDSTGRKAFGPGGSPVPPVTFIVVGKRCGLFSTDASTPVSFIACSHHVRFFPVNP